MDEIYVNSVKLGAVQAQLVKHGWKQPMLMQLEVLEKHPCWRPVAILL